MWGYTGYCIFNSEKGPSKIDIRIGMQKKGQGSKIKY